MCPTGVADRVNLGLIPSSKDGWLTACKALKPNSGGLLHIHSCVSSRQEGVAQGVKESKKSVWSRWANEAAVEVLSLLQESHPTACRWSVTVVLVTHVKSYAPHIDHVVVDLECRPSHKV